MRVQLACCVFWGVQLTCFLWGTTRLIFGGAIRLIFGGMQLAFFGGGGL